MSKTHGVLVSIVFLFAVAFVWRMNAPAIGAQADEGPAQTVEYKVVRAKELGILLTTKVKALNPEFEQNLNKLAAQGWRWKEFVPAGPQSAVVFVRRK